MKKEKLKSLIKFHLKKDFSGISKILKNDGVGIMPTDTIPGLVCSAFSPKGIKRIFKIKERPHHKPPVIIISQTNDLGLLGIDISKEDLKILERIWPAKISFILPCHQKSKKYLHQGMKSLAIRLPKNKWLRDLVKTTRPIATTSANRDSRPPAKTVSEALKTFSDQVDFYLTGTPYRHKNLPSTVAKIDFKNKKIQVLRLGADFEKLKKLEKGGFKIITD